MLQPDKLRVHHPRCRRLTLFEGITGEQAFEELMFQPEKLSVHHPRWRRLTLP